MSHERNIGLIHTPDRYVCLSNQASQNLLKVSNPLKLMHIHLHGNLKGAQQIIMSLYAKSLRTLEFCEPIFVVALKISLRKDTKSLVRPKSNHLTAKLVRTEENLFSEGTIV